MEVHGGKRGVSLDVSLRGTLAQEYVRRNEQDAKMATAWLRALLADVTTTANHPTFVLKLDTKTGKLIVGRRTEVGMYPPDW